MSLVSVGCVEVLGGSLCALFQTRACCLVCVVRMQIVGCS